MGQTRWNSFPCTKVWVGYNRCIDTIWLSDEFHRQSPNKWMHISYFPVHCKTDPSFSLAYLNPTVTVHNLNHCSQLSLLKWACRLLHEQEFLLNSCHNLVTSIQEDLPQILSFLAMTCCKDQCQTAFCVVHKANCRHVPVIPQQHWAHLPFLLPWCNTTDFQYFVNRAMETRCFPQIAPFTFYESLGT